MNKLLLFSVLLIFAFSYGQEDIDYSSEKSIRDYFEKNGTEYIEGIWETSSGARFAVIKDDYKFKAYFLETSYKNSFSPGTHIGSIETANVEGVLTIEWLVNETNDYKYKEYINSKGVSIPTAHKVWEKTIGEIVNNSLIKFTVYPKTTTTTTISSQNDRKIETTTYSTEEIKLNKVYP